MSIPWPAVTWEQVIWRSPQPAQDVSRSVRDLIATPYRAAITPRIGDLDVHLPRDVAADVEDAAEAIRAFDSGPGSSAGRFAALLLGAEAASSSRLGNLPAGAQATALAELGEPSEPAAVLVAGNVAAMRTAHALSGRIDPAAIRRVHAALLRDAAPSVAGRWREQQAWVGGSPISPHGALFVPPHHTRVPADMDDLVGFARRTDLPALTHAALVLGQVESIRPFAEGNGRVSRALLHAVLRRRRLAHAATVPVSAGLGADPTGYADALTAYRSGDVVPLVTGIAAASRAAVTNARRLVEDLTFTRSHWLGSIRARRDSSVWPLLDLVLRHPIVSTAVVRGELGISHTNAMRALARLTDVGLLQEVGDRRRSILWQAPQVLSALDAFAGRAGRNALVG